MKRGVVTLSRACRIRKFTPDGRLVGDVGEFLAVRYYDMKLYGKQTEGHDGETSKGWRVQVKATFGKNLYMRKVPDYLLGFQLREDGGFREVFNGPGELVRDLVGPPKPHLARLPVAELLALNEHRRRRIPLRTRRLQTVSSRHLVQHGRSDHGRP